MDRAGTTSVNLDSDCNGHERPNEMLRERQERMSRE